MAAVIFKSDKNVSDLPLSTVFGIELSKPLIPGANDRDFFFEQLWRGMKQCEEVLHVLSWERQCLVISDALQKLALQAQCLLTC